MALLSYRATSLQNGYSPSELLMSRNLCTTAPILRYQLKPKVVDLESLTERERDSEKSTRKQLEPVSWSERTSTSYPRTDGLDARSRAGGTGDTGSRTQIL